MLFCAHAINVRSDMYLLRKIDNSQRFLKPGSGS